MQVFGAELHLWAIPAAFVLAYIPAGVRNFLIHKFAGRFNNVQPRSQVADLVASQKITAEQGKLLDRCTGAHLNGLETFPLFVAAILFALQRGAPVATLNFYSALFLASRVAYNALYIGGTSGSVSGLRSLAWFVSVAASFTLLVRSI
jgi:uncharacterized MAPEG superfamily protein